MSKPPEDDPLDGVLSQVSDALDSLDLGDERTRARLLEGVREALSAIEGIDLSSLEPEDVLVVDHGTEEVHPDGSPRLRVVDTEEVERHTARQRTDVRVKVLGSEAKKIPTIHQEGVIALEAAPGATANWQTVFRGETARPYRIRCLEGVLEIAANGAVVEQLGVGQTMDLEARLIRVTCGVDGTCAGRYTRL